MKWSRRRTGRGSCVSGRVLPNFDWNTLKKMTPVGACSSDQFAQLLTTCKNTIRTALEFGDVFGEQTFESSVWVQGWLPILHKRVRDDVRDPDRNAKTV